MHDMDEQAELDKLKAMTSKQLGAYIGMRARVARVYVYDESQETFAKRVGVALRTYKRFETEGLGSMETFLKVLIALKRLPALLYLLPVKPNPPQPTPADKVKALKAASRRRNRQTPADH